MKKLMIFLVSFLFVINNESYGQSTFNWSDTTFEINGKKTIKLFYDLDATCSVNPCYDFGNNKLVYDTIIKFLKENPNLKIEIGGHEDSKANDSYCKERSERIVNYIKNTLIERGIKIDKIIPMGYGRTKQIIPETEIIIQDRMSQEYSRIEITIIGL